MSIETCSIHLNYLLINNQYPLVAEIAGELELYVGRRKRYWKKCFYRYNVAHKNYRGGRDIGKALINEALQIAIKNSDTLSVWPNGKAIPLYKRMWLDKIAFNMNHVIVDVMDYNTLL